mmetsp:Transcript_105698/g.215524  ORF Transcript_105698/g.215524 Transcript_105698/m.215524 type:complete len:468 (-) Transcript_105698:149-1552(-)
MVPRHASDHVAARHFFGGSGGRNPGGLAHLVALFVRQPARALEFSQHRSDEAKAGRPVDVLNDDPVFLEDRWGRLVALGAVKGPRRAMEEEGVGHRRKGQIHGGPVLEDHAPGVGDLGNAPRPDHARDDGLQNTQLFPRQGRVLELVGDDGGIEPVDVALFFPLNEPSLEKVGSDRGGGCFGVGVFFLVVGIAIVAAAGVLVQLGRSVQQIDAVADVLAGRDPGIVRYHPQYIFRRHVLLGQQVVNGVHSGLATADHHEVLLFRRGIAGGDVVHRLDRHGVFRVTELRRRRNGEIGLEVAGIDQPLADANGARDPRFVVGDRVVLPRGVSVVELCQIEGGATEVFEVVVGFEVPPNARVVLQDLGPCRAVAASFVVTGDCLELLRFDAVHGGGLVQPDEIVAVVPLPTGCVVLVDHDHAEASGIPEERVGEGHSGGTASDNEVVAFVVCHCIVLCVVLVVVVCFLSF